MANATGRETQMNTTKSNTARPALSMRQHGRGQELERKGLRLSTFRSLLALFNRAVVPVARLFPLRSLAGEKRALTEAAGMARGTKAARRRPGASQTSERLAAPSLLLSNIPWSVRR